MRGVIRAAAALLPLVAALALPAAAQTGGLDIAVVDPGKLPLPGATVTLSNSQGHVAESAQVTGSDGLASFPVLRVGEGYAIDVTFPGFARVRLSDLRVHSGRAQRLVVELSPLIEERVEVRASPEVVDLEETGARTRFSDTFLENLPVLDRLYQNVLTLAPGVKDADGDGNPNVHGARSRDFKALVAGVSNVDPLTGEWLSSVNFDTIEELEVITSGAGVEFGRAQGGFARLTQKQGSNEHEGVFNLIVRSWRLDGDGAASGSSGPVPEFETFQPALQLSGPIIRDKLWYRLSHELVDREDPVNVLSSVEVARREQLIVADQLTWQVSPRNKLAFIAQHDPLRVENFELSSRVREESSRTLERGGPTFAVSWTAAQSPRLLVDTLVSYQDQRVDVFPSTSGVDHGCLTFVRQPVLNETLCDNRTANRTSGSHFESSLDRRQRFTARTDATLFAGRAAGTSHRLKAGLIVENERYFRELERRPYVDDFVRIVPPFPPPRAFGIADGIVFVPRRSDSRATGTAWGVYLEDQIKLAPGLVVTAGLRFDREEIDAVGREPFDPLAERQRFLELLAAGDNVHVAAAEAFTAYEGVNTLHQGLAQALGVDINTVLAPFVTWSASWRRVREPDPIAIGNNNPAPRLSLAWDPFANGKTKIAASAGRYYDKIFLSVPLVELDPVESRFEVMALPPAMHLTQPLLFDGNLTSFLPLTVRMVQRDLRTPYQDELTFSAERELFPEASIKLSRIVRSYEDQFQDIDINHDEDFFTFNPGWADILLIGNFNTAEYDAWVLELTRRHSRGWELQASYTLSEAVGDAEDFMQLLGNSLAVRDAERSHLDFDQRHLLNVTMTTLTSWGWRLGGRVRYESGLPFSVVQKLEKVPFHLPPEFQVGYPGALQTLFVYTTGRRNDQRNEGFWTFDARVTREFDLGRDVLVQLSADVFNLLDDDTLIQEDRVDGAFEGTRRFGRQYQLGARVQF